MESARTHKGMGMEGVIARWYASTTRSEMEEFRALAHRMAAISPGPEVLEVAPGPGYFAIELAKLGGHRVTGLDISKTFVEIARKNGAEAGVRVDFQRGNVAAMSFPHDRFDFVVCRAAFKNFAEPLRALQEMYRVLKPGGRALIIDLRRDAPPTAINEEVDRMGGSRTNRAFIKLTFRFMLLKRAYTKAAMEQLITQTPFRSADIVETPIGLEISVTK